jgi:dienelactone hydrolase
MKSHTTPFGLIATTLLSAACAGLEGSASVGIVHGGDAGEVRPQHSNSDTVVADLDAAVIDGIWYISLGGVRYKITLNHDSANALWGTITAEQDDTTTSLNNIRWNSAESRLSFEFLHGDELTRIDAWVRDGVMVGRVEAMDLNGIFVVPARSVPVSGYNASTLENSEFQAFDVAIANGKRARIRVDSSSIATFKIYGSIQNGALDEELEYDGLDVMWDGHHLEFSINRTTEQWLFTGDVSGRTVEGTLTTNSGSQTAWHGVRAEVLSHGIAPTTNAERERWEQHTRARLAHLTMGGAPLPTRQHIQNVSTTVVDADASGGGYTLNEFRAEYGIADVTGDRDFDREVHFFVARPNGVAPRGGFPIAVALNGHWGSASQVMGNTSTYAYGTAFARRGYMVVAVDVGHRPMGQRGGLYFDYVAGDDADSGNALHSAVGDGQMWTEDGERAWDAMRALDYVLTLPNVNRERVLATGLSMGAEVATVFAAMDTRVSSVVAAGFSPDLSVVRLRTNHACWQWPHGDITEYIDWSDYHALIAPRRLMVQTGTMDWTFSSFATPFSSDKQVFRRARAAYGNSRNLLHDLHTGGHLYDVLSLSISSVSEPESVMEVGWQTDASSRQLRMNVFDFMRWAR